jgi:hypothetical protein
VSANGVAMLVAQSNDGSIIAERLSSGGEAWVGIADSGDAVVNGSQAVYPSPIEIVEDQGQPFVAFSQTIPNDVAQSALLQAATTWPIVYQAVAAH